MTVPIALHSSIDAIEHNVMAEVEFPLFVEQRPLYIFLKDVCFVCAIIVLFLTFQNGLYLVEL